ncbi:hypothetical protein BS50DRAFT_600765 [Corynespora cassiicola Philippines]|uniref:3CxxC-type domain-containing protein n=1 Tax=Corynespora cassiicola Philippines TaxID=1448308 RepID=A0A2T2NPP0_CORCC|nr:hypothetical protein BS50DRAFT_600765 [Corynespora cassiicola Philippines]
MYESLHKDVVDAVSNDVPSVWFQTDANEGFIKQYNTNLSGFFDCPNKRCRKKGWSTGVIATVIRGYEDNGYNAVICGQRCRSCNELGLLKLDEEKYVERVTRRIRIWAGVPVEDATYSLRPTPPHETDYCEGCRIGVCQYSPSRDVRL